MVGGFGAGNLAGGPVGDSLKLRRLAGRLKSAYKKKDEKTVHDTMDELAGRFAGYGLKWGAKASEREASKLNKYLESK